VNEPTPPVVVMNYWAIPTSPGRRPGFAERRLVGPAQSSQQNLVLIEAESGSEVEMHRVGNSECLLFFEGSFEVTVPGQEQLRLEAGDMVYFPPGMSHGLRCVAGPGRYLIVFAPAAAGASASAS
jgi:quercetin dioxygenase-like cupin family protein